ncbi:MAG: tetratricopeptide repeat protein [Polyangiales bacterium]
MNKSLKSYFLVSCLGLAACAKPAATPPPEVAPREERAEAPPPARSAAVRLAESLLAKGDAVGARNKFEEALGQEPRDARAWLGLGLAHEALNEPRQADGAYRRAIEVDPELAEAHNNLGLLLRDADRLEEAVIELREAVRLDPKLASGQANLALALEEAGQGDAALAAYRAAVKLAPKDAMLRANHGLFLLSQEDREGALKELRAGLVHGKSDRAALVALGNGLRRAGAADEAVRALRGAIAASDGKPTPALLSELALAQNAAGDGAGARASLEQALALDDGYATAHYLLGSMDAADGDVKSARKHYDKCIALEPDGPLAAKAKQKLAALKKAPRDKR